MPDPIDVPLQYFSLEIILEEVSLSLDRGVLSKEECLRAADKLFFNEHTVPETMTFFFFFFFFLDYDYKSCCKNCTGS